MALDEKPGTYFRDVTTDFIQSKRSGQETDAVNSYHTDFDPENQPVLLRWNPTRQTQGNFFTATAATTQTPRITLVGLRFDPEHWLYVLVSENKFTSSQITETQLTRSESGT